MVFRLGYVAIFFTKMNKVSLLLQRKQMIVFVTSDKIQVFKLKSQI